MKNVFYYEFSEILFHLLFFALKIFYFYVQQISSIFFENFKLKRQLFVTGFNFFFFFSFTKPHFPFERIFKKNIA